MPNRDDKGGKVPKLSSWQTFLRGEAERVALDRSLPWPEAEVPVEDARQVLHELRVHQIELEMQNDELRRTQAQLEATKERYFDLYDLAPVGYCTLGEAGRIVEANFTVAALLGVDRGALVERLFSSLIHREDQDVYYLHSKQAFVPGKPKACELRLVRADGTAFWAELVVTLVRDAEGVGVQRVILSDISDRKRLEAGLKQKTAELESARENAEKANLAKSEFLSRMSHELRSPLNAILGFAQLLESESLPAAQRSSVDEILRAGWYLLDLINELLDLALIESGKVSLCLEPVSVPEVLEECLPLVETQATKKKVRILLPRFDGPYVVRADRTRLKQVLVNLLSNAVKYNRARGEVEVDCVSDTASQRVRLSVRDTGHGLDAAKLEQLFQSFNRLGQESGGTTGSGIGLVVSRRLVELMGGRIGVQSTVGVGSVFWFELDLAVGPAGLETGVPGASAVASPALRTLLHVERNPVGRQLVERLITRRPNIRLSSAADAAEGIALAQAQSPDVILMDTNLPGMGGLEALGVLRANPATASIPVIAVTSSARPGDMEAGLAAGFFRYLTKAIVVNELLDALDLALERAHPR